MAGKLDDMTRKDRPVARVLNETRRAIEGHDGSISVAELFGELGQNSLSVVLMLPALAVVSPLSGVPLFSTFCGAMICLVSAQMLLGRSNLWLPGWLGRRRIGARAARKAVAGVRRFAKWLDRVPRKRLAALVREPLLTVLRAICLLCGAAMPFLELVPFSSSILGGVVSLLAVAMLTRDGLIALLTLAGLAAAAAALVAGLA